MTAKRIALRASLLVTLCAVLVPVLATGSASALTRGFSIYNVTGRTLRVDKIDVDGAAPVFEGAGLKQGTLLAPGAKVSLEVFRGFTGGENRIITIRYAPVQYNPEGQVLQDHPQIKRRRDVVRRSALQQRHRSMHRRFRQCQDAGPSRHGP